MKKMPNMNLNDGFLKCYRDKKQESDFNAPKNPKTEEDMKFIVELAFEEMSRRDQDMTFAETLGRTLSLKVKTRLLPEIDKKMKVVIEKTMYNVIKIDSDREKNVMFFYLEEVRKLAE